MMKSRVIRVCRTDSPLLCRSFSDKPRAAPGAAALEWRVEAGVIIRSRAPQRLRHQPRVRAAGTGLRRGVAMSKRVVVVGAGAIGGYTGGHRARNGVDVTFVDAWPEHVE